MKCLWTHEDMDTFSHFVYGTRAQNLSAPFSYILYMFSLISGIQHILLVFTRFDFIYYKKTKRCQVFPYAII
jgi:hypothetical protein